MKIARTNIKHSNINQVEEQFYIFTVIDDEENNYITYNGFWIHTKLYYLVRTLITSNKKKISWCVE